MAHTTLYGIRNCDTVKKARLWLDAHGVDHRFHDFKAEGVEEATVRRWCATLGWSQVLNRAGTTFRKLPDEAKADLDEARAILLVLEQPAMIKRPVLERGETIRVGFKPAEYEALFG